MEVNKDEAEKCLKIGAEALKRGDNARAIKFLKKSLQLYPLPGAEALLSQAERAQQHEAQEREQSNSTSGGSNGAGSARPARASSASANASAASSFARQESSTGPDGREYTKEQEDVVQQVLQAKKGGRGAHYRVLGLQKNCSDSELKKSYRKLSLKVHPDKNSAPQADEAFKVVSLAYATLSDRQKRAIYDRSDEEDPDNVGGGMRRGGGVHMHGQEVSPEEIFNMFFGGGMGGAGGMGGPGFHMYTNGFGGPGMHFQAGGPRRRARPGQNPRQHQQEAREGAGMQMLLQLLPIILIMFVSFFRFGDDSSSGGSYMPGEQRYFSLTHKPPFVNPLATKLSQVKDIPYFVSDKFLRSYYRDRYQLAQVERMVERAYEQYLVDECDSQTRFKQSLQRKATAESDPAERVKKAQKAQEFSLTRCSELEDLFPNRKAHYRKRK